MSIRGNAFLVATGIFASRIVGFLRQRCLNHYLGGNSDIADAFFAAFKIPNLLQNLFGEGALSGSFIPVYAKLVKGGEPVRAHRLATTVLCLLGAITSVLVLLGVLLAPWLIDIISPGFKGEKRIMAIALVRIFFPGAGILVMSAWCLGVLNCHGKFFLSYSAPVVWNVCIIFAILWSAIAGSNQDLIAIYAAFGALAGSVAQFVMQLPVIFSVHSFSSGFSLSEKGLKTVLKNFIPTALVRGIVQVSAYIDQIIGSLLPTGAITGLANAQLIYTLPVSLFGMSISAAALPELSRSDLKAGREIEDKLAKCFATLLFAIIPSAVAFLLLGDVIVATVYQSGAFVRADVVYVWFILMGSSLGLVAGTSSRLLSSTFYALEDARVPLMCAMLRVAVAALLGYISAVYGPELLNVSPRWGVVGITLASGLGAWIEYIVLGWQLRTRYAISITSGFKSKLTLWMVAMLCAFISYIIKIVLEETLAPLILGMVVLPLYVLLFVFITWLLGFSEAREGVDKVSRRLRSY